MSTEIKYNKLFCLFFERTAHQLEERIQEEKLIKDLSLDSEALIDRMQWQKEVCDCISQRKSLPVLIKIFNKRPELLNTSVLDHGTFLHFFAKSSPPPRVLSALLKTSIDPAIQDEEWQNTALIWAIANANNRIALKLIESDNPQHLDVAGWLKNTALHLAIAKGYKDQSAHGQKLSVSNRELVEELLDCGADPNLKNVNGDTPLHLAYLRRDIPMINELLSAGADPNSLNKASLKPIEMSNFDFSQACVMLKDVSGDAFLLDEEEHAASYDTLLRENNPLLPNQH